MQSEQFWEISGISCGRIMQQCDISGGWICSRVNGQAGVHAHRLGGASVDICIYSWYNFLFSLILRLRNSFICTFDGHYGLTFVHEQFFLNLQSVLKIFAQETYLCNYPWFWRGQFSVCEAVGAWMDNKGLQCLVKTMVTAPSPIYHTFLYLVIHYARLKCQSHLSHCSQSNISFCSL